MFYHYNFYTNFLSNRVWKDMSSENNITEYMRAKLAVWDYPVSDMYTKIWQELEKMKEKREKNETCESEDRNECYMPFSMDEALAQVRETPVRPRSDNQGFALIADATDAKYINICFTILYYDDKLFRYLTMTQCELQTVGEEFNMKPYALAVQKGSPLKDQLNDAYGNNLDVEMENILAPSGAQETLIFVCLFVCSKCV